jgi:hypothetical protein
MYEGMSESQKAIEKLRVMTGGDELMMAKAAQIINLETAQAILDPLKQAVIEGRNETGFNTKMILKDEDNPEYIFQVGEIPGSGLVITVTARWEIEGHETGDRKHTVNGKAPSTVEAKTQFVIHQGDLIKVATGREIEVPVEGGEKRGFFSKLIFGSAAETKKIPELIDERQAPTCEFKSCVITRTLYDDLVVEDLGLGEKHPKAPEMAVNEVAPLVDDIQDDLQEEAAIGNEAPRAQNRVIDEQERAAEIAEEIQIEQQPIAPEKDIREDAIDSLKEMLQGTLGTIVTDKEKLTEIEAYNYLFDINNAFISDFKDLDITYSIGDEDDRLKGGEIENKNGLNEVIAPVIEKLYTMAGEDTKVMKVATQCLNNEAARALFDGNVKTAIANGRELEGSPDYSFEVIETNGGLKIRTTAVWSISGSDEKAQGTLEFMIREGTMKQVVVQKEIRSGGGWFSNPKIEVISVFEEQKQPPTLEFISLTVA